MAAKKRKGARPESAERVGSADAAGAVPGENRRWILQLLDETRNRHQEAFPGQGAEEAVYFAHLNALMQMTEIFYRRLLAPHRLSQSEFRVINSLRLRGKGFRTTPLELNRFTQITSAGMTRTLDRLASAGHIQRFPNPEDRRSILIGLTDAGWAFAEKLAKDVAERYAEVLGEVSTQDRKAEIEQLRRVVERISAAILS